MPDNIQKSINKVLFIRSSHYADNGKVVKSNSLVDRLTNANFAELGIPLLAAYTPAHIEVEMVDDCLDELFFESEADVIAISAMIIHLNRAIDIAREFKKRGKIVVMGGYLPTMHPEKIQPYVDSICIGEGDVSWPQMLKDIENNCLKPVYKSETPISLENVPVPRYDLIKKNRIRTLFPVQATRGCPYRCSYCSIVNFYANTYRMRPVKDVIRDIKAHGSKIMFFVDDNLFDSIEYARELFQKMIGLNVFWGVQATTNIAKNKELLALAYKAGCRLVAVGMESISQENLNEVAKNWSKTAKYKETIETIQNSGIGFHALVMFGLPQDTKDIFDTTVDFLESAGVAGADFFILTPYPATILGKQYIRENKISDFDLNHYREPFVVFKHPNMTTREIQDGFWRAFKKLYSLKSIFRRIRLHKGSFLHKLYVLQSNFYYRRKIKRRIVPTHNQRGDYNFS